MLRPLLRVERRELVRQRGRTLLVLALVAVPVAAVVGGATLARITEPTVEERRARAFGQADLRIELGASATRAAELRGIITTHASLPPAAGQVDDDASVPPPGAAPRSAAAEPTDGPQLQLLFTGSERVSVPGRSVYARVVTVEPAAAGLGLADGIVRLVSGRAPANAGEVALSPVVLAALGRAPGDTVTLAYGPNRVITGVVVDPEELAQPLVLRARAHVEHGGRTIALLAPGRDVPTPASTSPPDRARTSVNGPSETGALPESRAAIDIDSLAARIEAAGFTVERAAAKEDGGGGLVPLAFVAGAIGFFEAALVIAAAFAVGLRRRRYEIGLLGAAGAPSGAILGAVLIATVALAAGGGVLGALLGALAAAAAHPFLDGWNGRENGPFELALHHLLGAILLGVFAALAAVAVPARTAARVPVGEALGSTRPPTAPARPWLVAGTLVGAAGIALLAIGPLASVQLVAVGVIAGPILGTVGCGLASPWLLERFALRAAPLPLAPRLAIRDAGRFRARNGPVVAAVLAAMSVSVAAAVLVASVEAALDTFPAVLRDDQILVEGPAAETVAARLAAELPCVGRTPLRAVYAQGEPLRVRPGPEVASGTASAWIACGGPELLCALGAATDARAFAEGTEAAGPLFVVEVPSRPRENGGAEPGRAVLETWRSRRSVATLRTQPVAVTQHVATPRFVLAEDALAALGTEAGPPLGSAVVPWLLRLEGPVRMEDLERARRLAAESPGTTVDAASLHARPARGAYTAALVVCSLTALVVVLVAVALSASESAADARILHAVGAGPRQIRSQAGLRAAYLALLGALLGIPAGILTSFALVRAANFPLTILLPWGDLALSTLALPAAAFAMAWTTAGSSPTSTLRARICRLAPRTALFGLGLLVLGWSAHEAGGDDSLTLRGDTSVAGRGSGFGSPLAETHAPDQGRSNARFVDAGLAGTDGFGLLHRDTHDTLALADERRGQGISPITWEPYTGTAFDGSPLAGELGRLHVPERHDHPQGPSIELAFVRYRTTNPHPGAPIVFLAGGPGASGVATSGPIATHPQLRLLEHADVIGLDQRGTGLTRPDLDRAFVERLSDGKPASRDEVAAAFSRAAARCAAHWESIGVDLSAYDTGESAEDIDALRRALGVPRLVLYGSSYGSHLGLAYLRHHEAQVERALFLSVEGPDHTWKLPSVVQQRLEAVAVLAAESEEIRTNLPDLLGTVRTLEAQLARTTITIPGPDNLPLRLGPFDLHCWIANALGSTTGIAALPAGLRRLERGDFTPLAETARELRRIEVRAMPLAMDCASGASPARWRRIAVERGTRENLLGDAIHAPYLPEGCTVCGCEDLGEEFRAPLHSDVPVVFVSGELDARTPPENVEEIRTGFPRSAHVRVTNASHDARGLMAEEFRDLLQAFLRGEPVTSIRITLPPIPFEPLPAGP